MGFSHIYSIGANYIDLFHYISTVYTGIFSLLLLDKYLYPVFMHQFDPVLMCVIFVVLTMLCCKLFLD